jgi:hypothetical protein
MASPLVPSRRGQQRDKIFRNAMRMALATMDDGDPGKALREIATACIEKAKAGDLQAAAFVRDTMDGKPAQMLEHTGEESRRIGRIVHEIVHVPQEIVDVTETREMIDREIDGQNLVVDYRETEAINGHGGNGHGGNGGNPVPERVGRHRE